MSTAREERGEENYKAGLGILLCLCAKNTQEAFYLHRIYSPELYRMYHADLLFDIFAFTYPEAQHPIQPR
jgi:hypothetical protein